MNTKHIVPEMRLGLIKEAGGKPLSIRCPDDPEKFVALLKMYSEEHFVPFHPDAKNAVTGIHGTFSASLLHPREVFKAAQQQIGFLAFRTEQKFKAN
ncbi:MAG: JAB domain-containing protein [Candidatus Obscuribacterales bacterium]|nr:JAB domain-containing protein [Candidatus Obscuribacterales bacterium]